MHFRKNLLYIEVVSIYVVNVACMCITLIFSHVNASCVLLINEHDCHCLP